MRKCVPQLHAAISHGSAAGPRVGHTAQRLRRRIARLTIALVISSAVGPALGLFSALQVSAAGFPAIGVFVGYADSLHSTGFFPSPWSGSPGVTFEGCTPSASCAFDGGAIELVNSSGAPVTINSVSVQLNAPGDTVPCVVNLWPANLSLAAGATLIDAQTASGAGSGCPSGGLFDTSDVGPNGSSWVSHCNNSGVVAQVTVTANGAAQTFADTQQVLNTGGIDLNACPTGTNESQPWTHIGGRPIPPGFMGGGGNPFAPQIPSCNAGHPVNCATGNLWETLNELSVPGAGCR